MNLRKLLGHFCGILRDTPLAWGLLAFGTWFYYAQFVPTIGWNAIELIIAQHLLDHGAYATSIDYPSALPWRPILPTLVVMVFRVTTADPLRIYQLVCGVSLASLVVSMFLCARLLWGRVAAHGAAFLTMVCPAVTIVLINHVHSYSHLVALLFLGPALYASLLVLQRGERGDPAEASRYALSGLAWGLACLCRGELVLFAAGYACALGWLHVRRSLGWRRMAPLLVAFALLWIPHHLLVGRVAARDGTLIAKPIYGMYASQGWVEPPPDVGPDVERDGYVYAIKLYGDPLDNNESMLLAIYRHPGLFARRVGRNAANFYRTLGDARHFGLWWGLAALTGVALELAGITRPTDRLSIVFLSGTFVATHFVLIFHVDPRYLTIAAPALILLPASLLAPVGAAWSRLRTPARVAVASAVLVLAAWTSHEHCAAIIHHGERPDRAIRAMDSLAQVFREHVPQPHLQQNREPHIAFTFPEPSPLRWEDMFLLGYFTRSAWYMHAPEAPFPRGRMYSFRECDDDYVFAPAALMAVPAQPNARKVVIYENPVLGEYTLWELGR